jgi:ribosomal protein S17
MWVCLVLGIQVADIENAGLKNGGEITIKECYKLSKRELSEAIKII